MATRDTFQKLIPDGYFHIYNRGNNKETIFKTPENYIYFLSLWKKYIEPVAETFCYSLLPNHFHFFVRIRSTKNLTEQANQVEINQTSHTSPKPIEKHFSNLFNAYAKAINKRFNRTGSLFQERFRRKEITSDSYYSSLIGYIITNPVKHGFCKRVEEYPYSAYASLLSTSATLLLRDEVMEWFGGKAAFVEFIKHFEEDIHSSRLFFEKDDFD